MSIILNKYFNTPVVSKKDYFKLFILTILVIISGFLEMLGIGSIVLFAGSIIDTNQKILLINKDTELYNYLYNLELSEVTLILLIIFIIKNIFLLFVIFFEQYFIYKIKILNGKKIFKYYLNSPLLKYKKFKQSDITRNIITENNQAAYYIQNKIIIVRELFIAFTICSFLFIAETSNLFKVIGFLALCSILFIRTLKNKLTNYGLTIFKKRSEILKITSTMLSGIKDIKLLNIEHFLEKNFHNQNTSAQKSQMYYDTYSRAPRLFIETAIVLVIFISAINFGLTDQVYVKDKSNFVENLSLLGASFIRLLPAFSSITTAISKNRFLKPSYDVIKKEIADSDLFINNYKNINNSKSEKLSIDTIDSIRAEKISYKYPGSNNLLLDDISLEIKSGQTICITGPSGHGKTTLCDIISCLIYPDNGNIFFNNKNIDELNKKKLFKNFSFITQKPLIIDDNIYENIVFGFESKITNKKISDYLDLVKLSEFSNKDELLIKKNVNELSGGQQQRLVIARSLLRDPKVLILDEATNAIDINMEKEIIKNIKSYFPKLILIIISHRKETQKIVDDVFLIENKKIKKLH